MGKMKELFMQMRELEMQNEEIETAHLDDEYLYEQYIQNKYKSPKHVCFMKNDEGQLVMLQGESTAELDAIAAKHKLQGEFMVMSPEKHLF